MAEYQQGSMPPKQQIQEADSLHIWQILALGDCGSALAGLYWMLFAWKKMWPPHTIIPSGSDHFALMPELGGFPWDSKSLVLKLGTSHCRSSD
jgi:hypothetical protein